LPQKYTEVVNQIAGSIDAGLVCYLNPDTLETDGFPQQLLSEIFDDEENEDEDPENKFELKYTQWESILPSNLWNQTSLLRLWKIYRSFE